jgi:hypothetical protein
LEGLSEGESFNILINSRKSSFILSSNVSTWSWTLGTMCRFGIQRTRMQMIRIELKSLFRINIKCLSLRQNFKTSTRLVLKEWAFGNSFCFKACILAAQLMIWPQWSKSSRIQEYFSSHF